MRYMKTMKIEEKWPTYMPKLAVYKVGLVYEGYLLDIQIGYLADGRYPADG